MLPESPSLVVPVLKFMCPETPAVPALLVCMKICPEEVAAPYPDLILIAPPEFAVAIPASTLTFPPETPCPFIMSISPAKALAEFPEAIFMSPESPREAVPVDTSK